MKDFEELFKNLEESLSGLDEKIKTQVSAAFGELKKYRNFSTMKTAKKKTAKAIPKKRKKRATEVFQIKSRRKRRTNSLKWRRFWTRTACTN